MKKQLEPIPHLMHTASAMRANRTNIYFRHPDIFTAFQGAIRIGIIPGASASARIEKLMAAELRKVGVAAKKAGLKLPESIFRK